MGLAKTRLIPALALLLGLAGSASAAPKLRLTTASIGPLVIATGADVPQQAVDAFNVGDGALALAAAANVPWITPVVGDAGNCSLRPGTCTPIRMNLSTAGLAKGLHTGLVTISDPNAADAPQTVTVTVQVGGAVPDAMSFHVTPGGQEEQVIRASNPLGTITSTETGGNWLSVPVEGGGSFRFNYSYRILARHLQELGEGEYRGQLSVLNSRLQEENKNVPVTLKVTSGPILTAPASLLFRLAEGGALYAAGLSLGNRGGGVLAVSEVRLSTESGGDWMAAEIVDEGRGVRLKVQPAGLAQGIHKGTVELISNAANSPHLVPVFFEVMASGPPAADYATVTNLASTDPDPIVSPGMLVQLRGTQITAMEEAIATEAPYPSTLAGVQVFVNGIEGAILRAASDELFFQIPYEVPPGAALIQLVRDGQSGNFVEVTVAERLPRIEPAPASGYGRALFEDGALAIPIALGGRPARAGDAVTLQAIGLGRTDPPVATGSAPAEPVASVPEPVRVTIGTNLFTEGVVVDATAALIPGSPGRYAVRFTMPAGTLTGDRVALTINVGGAVSNRVYIAIE